MMNDNFCYVCETVNESRKWYPDNRFSYCSSPRACLQRYCETCAREMLKCTTCHTTKPLWYYGKYGIAGDRDFRLCLPCFSTLLDKSIVPSKTHIRGRYECFAQNVNYWGLTDWTSLKNTVYSRANAGQIVLWEFYDNMHHKRIVQVVTYLTSPASRYYHWYIIQKRNILYVTRELECIDRCRYFFGYKSTLEYIRKMHVRERHRAEVVCTCKPLSRFALVDSTRKITYSAWSLQDTTLFYIHNNMHGFYSVDYLLSSLPSRLLRDVSSFDTARTQCNHQV
jgi:hypothetical protein